MQTLQEKIDYSIGLIKKYEQDAIRLNDGYTVCFSGGKDSQVMLDLFKKSGVKFKAVYNVTTNDPPENVRFIRTNYPDVEFSHPKLTFLQLIEKKNMLPTMVSRFCCAYLKENTGKGFVAVGVRREESFKRSNYKPISFQSRRHEDFDTQKLNKSRKVIVKPILEWKEDEIWQYIDDNNLPINPCYDHSGRVGCLFCPYRSKKALIWNKEHYPLFYRNLMRTVQKMIENGCFKRFENKEQVWDWWISKLSVDDYFNRKRQLKLEF